MLDKIRNLIFDIKDLIIVIIIVSILFFAVTWKVNETLNLTPDSGDVVVIDPGTVTQPTSASQATDSTSATSESSVSSSTNPNISTPTTSPSIQPVTTASTVSTTASTTTAASGGVYQLVVTEGEYAQHIGANLEALGLVSSADAFVERATELGVAGQLYTGTYTFYATDDLDTILRILTGGSR